MFPGAQSRVNPMPPIGVTFDHLLAMVAWRSFAPGLGVTMWKLALSVALPALAIVIAALAQLLLTIIWPGVRRIPVAGVSADSSLAVLLSAALCFVAAAWLQRNVRSLAGALCAAVVPAAWLGLVLWSILRHFPDIAWFRPGTLFFIAAAIAPLAGVAAGWSASLMHSNSPESMQP